MDGSTAIVGFQGAIQIAPDLSQPVLATAKIVDGDLAGKDSFNVDPGDVDCNTYQPGASTAYGDIDVVDSVP